MGEQRTVLGIDLGGTHFQLGVVRAPEGEIVARRGGKTLAERGAGDVIGRLVKAGRGACEDAGIEPRELEGVGIGAPGAIDLERGVVLIAPNLGWDDVALGERVSAELGGVRVSVDNDVNAAVWGEFLLGAAKELPSVLGVWIGTGVGGGLVLAGRLHHGDMGTAGEIGQTVVEPDKPCGRGVLEKHCSRSAIEARLERAIERGTGTSLELGPEGDDRITSSAIARAYRGGDHLVVRIVEEAMEMLSLSIANHLSVLGIASVVLGGGLSERMGADLEGLVARGIRRHVFPPELGERVTVRVTELRENAGLLGAAMLALER